MKIKRVAQTDDATDLAEFADEHGLEILVTDRDWDRHPPSRYCAEFANARSFYAPGGRDSMYAGYGDTEREAIRNLAKSISYGWLRFGDPVTGVRIPQLVYREIQ